MTETERTTSQEEKPDHRHHSKSEWIRSTNYEDKFFWFMNFFYCFYFPYICRIDPLTEEDVPVIAEHDQTEKNSQILKKSWQPKFEEYEKNRKQYLEFKAKDSKFLLQVFLLLSLHL